MKGQGGLEEPFAIPETLLYSAGFVPEYHWRELGGRLLDIRDRGLREMDAHGMQMLLVSLDVPAMQAIRAAAKAVETATRANDYLAFQVQRCPDRFQGFAALPIREPDLTSVEPERRIMQLEFKLDTRTNEYR
jgi:gamma-resorcylate decarboxylase